MYQSCYRSLLWSLEFTCTLMCFWEVGCARTHALRCCNKWIWFRYKRTRRSLLFSHVVWLACVMVFRLPTQLSRQISCPGRRRSCLGTGPQKWTACCCSNLLWQWSYGRSELSVVSEQELHATGVNKRKKGRYGKIKEDGHFFTNRMHVFYTCDCQRDFTCPQLSYFFCSWFN